MKREETPLIIITSKEDLAKFFPNTWDKFHRFGPGEWHGPCPHCGGKDRCIVSNGFVRCRQSAHNWTDRQRNPTDGVPLSWLASDYVPDPEEMRKAQEKFERELAIERSKREERIIELTNSRVWEKFHEELLLRPERVADLEADGITDQVIRTFKIGLNPGFVWYEIENNEKIRRINQAYTFPIFHRKTIQNVTGFFCTNIRHRLLPSGDEDLHGNKYRPIYKGLGADYLGAFHKGIQWGFLVEGEKKALNLWRRGVPAIGLWGFETFLSEWIPDIKGRFPERRYVLFDHDANSQTFERVWAKCQDVASWLDAIPVQLPMVGKIDDLLNSGQLTVSQLMNIVENSRKEYEEKKMGVRIL